MVIIKKIRNASVDEDMEKKEPLYTGGWEYKLVQPLQTTVWRFLTNLKIELPRSPMFIAALFIISKIRKQPKCSSVDEENVVYMYIEWNIIHNGILFSQRKE